MNRIHIISVPYSVMKACPLSWVQRVHVHKGKDILNISVYVIVIWLMDNHVESTVLWYNIFHFFHVSVCTARVALVKCRDLHWAMMAHRDQKDTNLSSLRMLIVADGANPCK